MIFKIY